MRRRIRNDQPIQLQANPFQSISNNQTNSNKNKLYSTTAYSTRIKISEKNKTKPKKNLFGQSFCKKNAERQTSPAANWVIITCQWSQFL